MNNNCPIKSHFLLKLTPQQKQRLQKESDDTGLSMSELTRRAIDFYLDRRFGSDQQQQQFAKK